MFYGLTKMLQSLNSCASSHHGVEAYEICCILTLYGWITFDEKDLIQTAKTLTGQLSVSKIQSKLHLLSLIYFSNNYRNYSLFWQQNQMKCSSISKRYVYNTWIDLCTLIIKELKQLEENHLILQFDNNRNVNGK